MTPRHAFPRLPDLRVIERAGWLQIVTPSIKTGGLNEVLYSLLDAHDADAVIDEAIAIYRDLGLGFRWNAAPGSGPADLGERLVRRGLEESWGRGMARSTEVVVAPSGTDTAVVVVGPATLAHYTHVMAAGWSADPIALGPVHRHLLADERYHLFVAYSDGEPAAAASYLAFERSAFLMAGVVLPRYRSRGLYRALVAARLGHARSRGIELAATHAREASSAPILERLGFETVCRFAMYFG
ncbi:MAG: GNAT family N-acetyltransferase [Deltaproteobacteria bacterium]